jgi:hypothetical protein
MGSVAVQAGTIVRAEASMSSTIPVRVLLLASAGLLAIALPAAAQFDLSGEWTARTHEDTPHRIPGPELGDFTGLPLNAAARQKAVSWDASILSQPEQQAKPHPAQYSMRGPGPTIRWTKIVDPLSGRLVAFTLVGTFGRADRVIWMDGRPHPSPYAEHTFAGFSTGEWEGNALKVTTTHMKAGFIQRNGAPSSYKAVMTEYFVRHDDHLLLFSIVDDPVYLEEPMVRTHNFVRAPQQHVGLASPFETVDEVDMPLGWVPHYPLGTRHTEFTDRFGLPEEAAAGGKETLYPEYAKTVQRMIAERGLTPRPPPSTPASDGRTSPEEP